MHKKIAVYPGSFDPLTNGHIDIIRRACRLFDKVVTAIVLNPNKQNSLFSVDERLDMLANAIDGKTNLEFDSFEGLLVDYADQINADVIIRGIRAFSDFEYEMQMALMNKRLSDELETVFLMPREEHTYVSSRLVKEIASLGGSVNGLVHPYVEQQLIKKFGN